MTVTDVPPVASDATETLQSFSEKAEGIDEASALKSQASLIVGYALTTTASSLS